MMRLRAVFGDHPHTRALLLEQLASPDISFDFFPVKGRLPFRDFVRNNKFDLGEFPLVPLLQARELGKPLVLLPVVLTQRHQHASIYVRADSSLTANDLSGRRIAVRSDANTGVAWALGILANDYGVDLESLTLVDFDDNHIAEYVSPPSVHRAAPGNDIVQILADGEVDAAITEADLSGDARVRHLFADPATEAERWQARHSVIPAGHIVALNADVSAAHPGLAKDIFELLRRSQAAASTGSQPRPFGADALHDTLALMIDYSLQQGLIKRRLNVDELYGDATRALRA
jgi:4,5-dihydroxyphthalate decarboxylase